MHESVPARAGCGPPFIYRRIFDFSGEGYLQAASVVSRRGANRLRSRLETFSSCSGLIRPMDVVGECAAPTNPQPPVLSIGGFYSQRETLISNEPRGTRASITDRNPVREANCSADLPCSGLSRSFWLKRNRKRVACPIPFHSVSRKWEKRCLSHSIPFAGNQELTCLPPVWLKISVHAQG